jgi:hypothetical protein
MRKTVRGDGAYAQTARGGDAQTVQGFVPHLGIEVMRQVSAVLAKLDLAIGLGEVKRQKALGPHAAAAPITRPPYRLRP